MGCILCILNPKYQISNILPGKRVRWQLGHRLVHIGLQRTANTEVDRQDGQKEPSMEGQNGKKTAAFSSRNSNQLEAHVLRISTLHWIKISLWRHHQHPVYILPALTSRHETWVQRKCAHTKNLPADMTEIGPSLWGTWKWAARRGQKGYEVNANYEVCLRGKRERGEGEEEGRKKERSGWREGIIKA